MRVELDIVFRTTHPVWPHLRQSGGAVINTASVPGLRGIGAIGQAAHSAARGE
ncbi:hypothetical protein OIE62_39515 [Streptomyces scopuliridis]|uniref:Uncharacterized protein n=1 Tax=Streptomyces scopuliridis TaxID=452529 RepID=A0ACD4ZDG6_9ACTN|nr:hypothetical protein [Streptomyces scopuliridis]WSB31567.1 hypothetical protein OG949_00825 [Streptomyces scopuliridis]WSB95812.1 hypothetical protein OG835_01410 [Streptomyces scopuliridis]WSC10481.1 hypothetical protein OIE62_39515 [Streptomyces scopuliridis]